MDGVKDWVETLRELLQKNDPDLEHINRIYCENYYRTINNLYRKENELLNRGDSKANVDAALSEDRNQLSKLLHSLLVKNMNGINKNVDRMERTQPTHFNMINHYFSVCLYLIYQIESEPDEKVLLEFNRLKQLMIEMESQLVICQQYGPYIRARMHIPGDDVLSLDINALKEIYKKHKQMGDSRRDLEMNHSILDEPRIAFFDDETHELSRILSKLRPNEKANQELVDEINTEYIRVRSTLQNQIEMDAKMYKKKKDAPETAIARKLELDRIDGFVIFANLGDAAKKFHNIEDDNKRRIVYEFIVLFIFMLEGIRRAVDNTRGPEYLPYLYSVIDGYVKQINERISYPENVGYADEIFDYFGLKKSDLTQRSAAELIDKYQRRARGLDSTNKALAEVESEISISQPTASKIPTGDSRMESEISIAQPTPAISIAGRGVTPKKGRIQVPSKQPATRLTQKEVKPKTDKPASTQKTIKQRLPPSTSVTSLSKTTTPVQAKITKKTSTKPESVRPSASDASLAKRSTPVPAKQITKTPSKTSASAAKTTTPVPAKITKKDSTKPESARPSASDTPLAKRLTPVPAKQITKSPSKTSTSVAKTTTPVPAKISKASPKASALPFPSKQTSRPATPVTSLTQTTSPSKISKTPSKASDLPVPSKQPSRPATSVTSLTQTSTPFPAKISKIPSKTSAVETPPKQPVQPSSKLSTPVPAKLLTKALYETATEPVAPKTSSITFAAPQKSVAEDVSQPLSPIRASPLRSIQILSIPTSPGEQSDMVITHEKLDELLSQFNSGDHSVRLQICEEFVRCHRRLSEKLKQEATNNDEKKSFRTARSNIEKNVLTVFQPDNVLYKQLSNFDRTQFDKLVLMLLNLRYDISRALRHQTDKDFITMLYTNMEYRMRKITAWFLYEPKFETIIKSVKTWLNFGNIIFKNSSAPLIVQMFDCNRTCNELKKIDRTLMYLEQPYKNFDASDKALLKSAINKFYQAVSDQASVRDLVSLNTAFCNVYTKLKEFLGKRDILSEETFTRLMWLTKLFEILVIMHNLPEHYEAIVDIENQKIPISKFITTLIFIQVYVRMAHEQYDNREFEVLIREEIDLLCHVLTEIPALPNDWESKIMRGLNMSDVKPRAMSADTLIAAYKPPVFDNETNDRLAVLAKTYQYPFCSKELHDANILFYKQLIEHKDKLEIAMEVQSTTNQDSDTADVQHIKNAINQLQYKILVANVPINTNIPLPELTKMTLFATNCMAIVQAATKLLKGTDNELELIQSIYGYMDESKTILYERFDENVDQFIDEILGAYALPDREMFAVYEPTDVIEHVREQRMIRRHRLKLLNYSPPKAFDDINKFNEDCYQMYAVMVEKAIKAQKNHRIKDIETEAYLLLEAFEEWITIENLQSFRTRIKELVGQPRRDIYKVVANCVVLMECIDKCIPNGKHPMMTDIGQERLNEIGGFLSTIRKHSDTLKRVDAGLLQNVLKYFYLREIDFATITPAAFVEKMFEIFRHEVQLSKIRIKLDLEDETQ